MRHPVDAWLLGAAVFIVALFGGGWWFVSRQPLPEVEFEEDAPVAIFTSLEWEGEYVWVTTQLGERSVTQRFPVRCPDGGEP